MGAGIDGAFAEVRNKIFQNRQILIGKNPEQMKLSFMLWTIVLEEVEAIKEEMRT